MLDNHCVHIGAHSQLDTVHSSCAIELYVVSVLHDHTLDTILPDHALLDCYGHGVCIQLQCTVHVNI